MNQPLLPSGLMDVLPPAAAQEFRLIHHFLKTFMAFGYQPVIPPLAEYSETILAGQGEATSHHVFRMQDPLAPHMLGLRADITGQLARIASSSLAAAPRPLRLCYAGYTLRTTPEALKTRRQHTQIGIERFGDAATHSISEVLAIAAHALSGAGVNGLTIDLHYPSVMQALLAELPPATHAAVREAARLKDGTGLRKIGATLIADVVDVSGDAASVLAKLGALKHPAIAKATAELFALTVSLSAQQVAATITIDMLDLTGYGYYSGIGYALYWNALALEVGRGGCYQTSDGADAVGFTLYLNDVLDSLPAEPAAPVKSIPPGTSTADAAKLQAQGFVTVFGD